jgi:acetoin utilization protein AcuB
MSRYAIRRHMSVSVHAVTSRHTLAEAHQVMRERGVRHLPVVDEGRLVGVVSQRDLYLLETLKGVDPGTETVREAMAPDPYAVPPDAPLEAVAAAMAENKYGSAVVVDRGAVIGLFTTVDALRALAAVVGRRRPGPPERARPARET